jgi:cold shock CspA family protein
MLKETIRRICDDGTFGFIVPDDGSGDVFFHRNDFVRAGMTPPRVGDAIEFESVPSPKGRKVGMLVHPELEN